MTGRREPALFARLISHQPAVLFSQNEPATSNQPQPASSTFLSEQTSTSHQPPANRTGCTILLTERLHCIALTQLIDSMSSRTSRAMQSKNKCSSLSKKKQIQLFTMHLTSDPIIT
jgi:hypothetical protein